jgi:hypothetical protein
MVAEKDPADEAARLKIEQRAYEIWQSEGSPQGCDVDHWLRAEAEITSSRGATPAADAESRPAPAK